MQMAVIVLLCTLEMNNVEMIFSPENTLVTFSEFSFNPASHLASSLVCRQEPEFETITRTEFDPQRDQRFQESLPSYPYTFNPDIYKRSSFSIPHNILRTVPRAHSKTAKDISVQYHMPHWNYVEFDHTEQRKFIGRYFPERLELYKKYTREEEQTYLFVYLWLYMNGGVYIHPDYELLKSLESILDATPSADLYFTFDQDRYISPRFLASQPFCQFWIDAVNLMEKRKKYKYIIASEEIDRNTGRGLLTDIVDESRYRFEMIPRSQLDPYTSCDTDYNKDTYLCPSKRNRDFMTYVSCQTGTETEMLYITGAVVLIIIIMFIIALITN